MTEIRTEDLLRDLAPQVLGALVRRYGHFDACEDAVQEALIAAATQWPADGRPSNPRGWLVTVASRRLTDQLRSQSSRQRREEAVAARLPVGELVSRAADDPLPSEHDDTLTLLVLCCHPALTPASQIALTLRAIGGLTTAEIASSFLVPEATMAQRISRAKQTIKGAGLEAQAAPDPASLRNALHVLYLIFNEGYTATTGDRLVRVELTTEAIRLARTVHRLRPNDPEVAGLLALMLLTEARRPARTRADGSLVPLADQDRSRWDHSLIGEGVDLITRALTAGEVGAYQLQAAIAAIHDEAPSAGNTDWPQILALYELLERIAPNPMVTLNRAVAVAEVHGPCAGLQLLDTLHGDSRLGDHHRLHAVRAHMLELVGDDAAAREHYRAAARKTTSTPERRYLEEQAARLATGS